jgi:hypothetical protein
MIVLAATATVVVLAAVGVAGAFALSPKKKGAAEPAASTAAAQGTTSNPPDAKGTATPKAWPSHGGTPAGPGAPQPWQQQPGEQQPGGQQPAPQPAKPTTAPPPSGSKTMNQGTNYGRATGSVSWNGTSAKASGELFDTAQYDSNSWLRIAYRMNESGTWKLHYVQPDPYVNVSNGQRKSFSWSLTGQIKDVQWDVCSKRLDKTYCTGWR